MWSTRHSACSNEIRSQLQINVTHRGTCAPDSVAEGVAGQEIHIIASGRGRGRCALSVPSSNRCQECVCVCVACTRNLNAEIDEAREIPRNGGKKKTKTKQEI